jgi:hypothetical protein
VASSFTLELDTTPPQIEIFAPSYTSNTSLTTITIEANEDLAKYQNIYMTDQYSNTYPLYFIQRGNKLIGYVNFMSNGGIYTIYAQVKDEVHNESDLISFSIRVLSGDVLSLSIDDAGRTVNLMNNDRMLTSENGERHIPINVISRKLSDVTSVRIINTENVEVT